MILYYEYPNIVSILSKKCKISQSVFCCEVKSGCTTVGRRRGLIVNTFQLACFLSVAENLSFARAAEQLHVTQPAVTHQIKVLEQELATDLFHRSTRSVALTRNGQLFLEDARQILELERQAKSRFEGEMER